MRQALALAAYSLLLRLATPLYLLRLVWRGRAEPGYREALAERLAFYGGEPPSAGWVWLHAVSLGETRAATALVAALRERLPGMRLLLTHGTATGRAAGAALLAPGDRQTWFPYDTPGAARRFMRHFRPAAGVLMETEIWPNTMAAAQREGVPVVLANARLSERSLRRAQGVAAVMRPATGRLALALAQTEADAARLAEAGAPRVEVCGNLKFDVAPDAALVALGRRWREAVGRPVVLATSTREGEEAALLDAWRAALPPGAAPRPLLVVVPRHPQRFDEVAALLGRAGPAPARRSGWHDAPGAAALAADVWLGDSMGEMPLYYGLADVALLGGSFEPLGGQNLIEAAACGCPVLMGPHTFNFAQAAELAEAAGAARRVPTMADAVAAALEGLAKTTPERAAREHEACLAFAAAHRGAAQRMAGRIAELAAPAAATPRAAPPG